MDANNENKKDASSAPKRLSRKVYCKLSIFLIIRSKWVIFFSHKGSLFAHKGSILVHKGSILAHKGSILAQKASILAEKGRISIWKGLVFS